MVDSLRKDHVGAYGYARDTTPTIDRLAARGLVFDDVEPAKPAPLDGRMRASLRALGDLE